MKPSIAAIPILALAVTACETQEPFERQLIPAINNRYGPNPRLTTADLNANAARQINLMNDFGYADGKAYESVIAGFNFVDEQCDIYLHSLFVLKNNSERTNDLVSGVGTLTNAILGLSPASKETMGIVAQSFGLGLQYTRNVLGSYLFGSDVETIASVVGKLQYEYRVQTEAAKNNITSAPVAYGYVRGYLKLCLPPTIISKIKQKIETSDAVSTNTTLKPQKTQNNVTASSVPPAINLQ